MLLLSTLSPLRVPRTETVHRTDNSMPTKVTQGDKPEHIEQVSKIHHNNTSDDEVSECGEGGESKLSQPCSRRRFKINSHRESLHVQCIPAFHAPTAQHRVFEQLLNGVGRYKTLLQLAGTAVIIAYIVSDYRSH